jgi:hypothetical protein
VEHHWRFPTPIEESDMVRSARSLTLLALALAGCGAGEPAEQPPAEPAAEFATPATPSDFTGTWEVVVVSEAGDTLPGHRLMATPDTAGWTMAFADRPAMPVRVLALAGDSVVTEFGPYESVVRPGVTVLTTVTHRRDADGLRGALVARYSATGPDSILRAYTEARRIP